MATDMELRMVLTAEVARAQAAMRDVQERLRQVGGEALRLTDAQRDNAAASGGMARGLASVTGSLAGSLAAVAAAALSVRALSQAFAGSVRAAADAERSHLTLQQVVRATGGAAGRSAGDIEAMSRKLGRETLASTEGVRAAAAQLLTFRSVAGETFDRTLAAAQDLAADGFGTIESAAVQLGKALEDPEQGLSALARVGVSFSAAQKQVISDMMATGRAAEAQKVILAAVEAQVGGAGKAAAGGLAGAFDTLGEEMGRFREVVGKNIADLIGLKDKLDGVASAVRRVTEAMDVQGLPQLDRQADDLRAFIRELEEAREGNASPRVRAEAGTNLLTGSVNQAAVRAMLETARSDLTELEARLGDLRADARLAAIAGEAQAAQAAAKAQAEAVEGVIDALRREAEAAQLTKIEQEVLAAQRKVGVEAASAEGQAIEAAVRAKAAALSQAEGEQMLAALQAQNAEREIALRYGADSVQAAEARAAAERAALVELIEAKGFAADLAAEIMAADDAGRDLASLDMSPGIAAARDAAAGLAAQLGVALDVAVRIRAEQALAAAKFEFSPGGQALIRYGSRAPGGTAEQQALERRNAPVVVRSSGGGGGGGGGGAGDLSRLLDEARRVMPALDLALAQVQERVRAGLMSASAGADAVAQAKERAAGALADLIPRLEALGPAGAEAVAALRRQLADLGPELEKVRSPVEELHRSFEGVFADMITGAKSAGEAFSDMSRLILAEVARMAAERFVTPLLTPLLNGLFGSLGFADGGVVRAGVQAFAAGGVPGGVAEVPSLRGLRERIVNGPTLFPMARGAGLMGEAGPEAIMPLVSGLGGHGVRAIMPGGEGVLPLARTAAGVLAVEAFATGGVPGWAAAAMRGGVPAGGRAQAAGGTAPTGPVIINLNGAVAEGATARTTGDRMEGDSRIIDVMVERLRDAMVADVTRGKGLGQAIEAAYGLRRAPR